MTFKPLVLAALASCLFVAGCGGSNTEDTKLTLESEAGGLHVRDVPPKGPSPGDTNTFSEDVVDTDGKPAGRVNGTVTVTQVITRGGRRVEDRVGTTHYTLQDGSVTVGGVYTAPLRKAAPASGVTRPIVGGTGKYKGAHGQVVQSPEGRGLRHELDIQTPKD